MTTVKLDGSTSSGNATLIAAKFAMVGVKARAIRTDTSAPIGTRAASAITRMRSGLISSGIFQSPGARGITKIGLGKTHKTNKAANQGGLCPPLNSIAPLRLNGRERTGNNGSCRH